MSEELHQDNLTNQVREEIDERIRAVENPTERRTIAGLLRELGHLPLERTRAALETSAAIAAVSLRASIEFLRAVPQEQVSFSLKDQKSAGEMQPVLAADSTTNEQYRYVVMPMRI